MKKDKTEFEKKLTELLNYSSLECESDTPDFILAQYLIGCLETYNTTIQSREKWYGRTVMYKGTLPVPAQCPPPKSPNVLPNWKQIGPDSYQSSCGCIFNTTGDLTNGCGIHYMP
jgi:hypothetical protein